MIQGGASCLPTAFRHAQAELHRVITGLDRFDDASVVPLEPYGIQSAAG